MENDSQLAIPGPKDLVQHYHKKWEEETKEIEALRYKLSFQQGSLANERRMKQWLERKLDKVMRALESTEATLNYRHEFEFVDELGCIVELTNRDVEDERRQRRKLEKMKEVIERAMQIEKNKHKFEEESKTLDQLKNNIETTQKELIQEMEYIAVLKRTIEDMEQPLRHGITKGENEEEKLEKLQHLECLKKEFVEETRERQRLEREIVELEEAMSRTKSKAKLEERKETENATILDDMKMELMTEKKLRQELEKKLANAEVTKEDGHTELRPVNVTRSEEYNMQENFLKCTLDKLSAERKTRVALQEKVVELEQTIQKVKAKLKVNEGFLTLTQKELTEEREMREKIVEQLAEKEKQLKCEEAKKVRENDDHFDEKLNALEKILTSIQDQHKYEDDALDSDQSEMGLVEELRSPHHLMNLGVLSQQSDDNTSIDIVD